MASKMTKIRSTRKNQIHASKLKKLGFLERKKFPISKKDYKILTKHLPLTSIYYPNGSQNTTAEKGIDAPFVMFLHHGKPYNNTDAKKTLFDTAMKVANRISETLDLGDPKEVFLRWYTSNEKPPLHEDGTDSTALVVLRPGRAELIAVDRKTNEEFSLKPQPNTVIHFSGKLPHYLKGSVKGRVTLRPAPTGQQKP